MIVSTIIGIAASSANGQQWRCQTPHREQVFLVLRDRVVFISPVPGTVLGGGWDKDMQYRGYRYRIHIADARGPNPLEDYVSLDDREGHRMSYSITCSPSSETLSSTMTVSPSSAPKSQSPHSP